MNQANIFQIVKALSCFNPFREKTFLIKLGGSILHHDQHIESLCHDLKILKQAAINIIIVHGGSQAINQALAKQNIQTKFIDGLRVTSLAIMRIIERVLRDQVNKLLVRKLMHAGIHAIGLSGGDNEILKCDYYSEQHGYVGIINSINPLLIREFLFKQSNSLESIPIIAPIGVDANGNSMNINADYAASHLAMALKVNKLIYLTDQDGIYDKEGKLLPKLSNLDLLKLIENKTIHSGMLVKAKAILATLEHDLSEVHILNGNKKHILIEKLFTEKKIGTLCKKIKAKNSRKFLGVVT